jgi:hypothetical protein
MSAVRGSNVLPILEMLVAEGVDLSNADDGTPWGELRAPILAADLRLGAGPIATAIADKARVIVAGHYDGAAPAIAHAVTSHHWSWQDYRRLAAAAVAARVATWRCWDAEAEGSRKPWLPGHVEVDERGRTLLTSAGQCYADALREWLRSGEENDSTADGSADVVLHLENLSVQPANSHQLRIDAAGGAKPDGCWRLDILYHAGYSAETLVEFSPSSDELLRQYAVEAAALHLQPSGDAAGLLQVDPLNSLAGDRTHWLRLAYQTSSINACRFFAERATQLAATLHPHARLTTGPPQVHGQCGLWSARVPRDAVDIAVETRVAKEWL